jgi:hypothetical protein
MGWSLGEAHAQTHIVMCWCAVELAGRESYVDEGEVLVDRAPPDRSLRELPSLSLARTAFQVASRRTRPALAWGTGLSLRRRQASQSCPAQPKSLGTYPWQGSQSLWGLAQKNISKIS